MADGKQITIDEQTQYPFSEDVTLTIGGLGKKGTATFPLYLRIPDWTGDAHVQVNGQSVDCSVGKGLLRINRTWREGD